MNMAQINMNQVTGEEAIGDDHKWVTVSSHNRYNLRSRPTKRNNRFTLLKDGQQSAMEETPKPHAHMIMTQINI